MQVYLFPFTKGAFKTFWKLWEMSGQQGQVMATLTTAGEMGSGNRREISPQQMSAPARHSGHQNKQWAHSPWVLPADVLSSARSRQGLQLLFLSFPFAFVSFLSRYHLGMALTGCEMSPLGSCVCTHGPHSWQCCFERL